MSGCTHPGFFLKEGNLVCATCGMPSPSPKWREKVYGGKAVEQHQTENKGLFWPPESKRTPGRPRKNR